MKYADMEDGKKYRIVFEGEKNSWGFTAENDHCGHNIDDYICAAVSVGEIDPVTTDPLENALKGITAPRAGVFHTTGPDFSKLYESGVRIDSNGVIQPSRIQIPEATAPRGGIRFPLPGSLDFSFAKGWCDPLDNGLYDTLLPDTPEESKARAEQIERNLAAAKAEHPDHSDRCPIHEDEPYREDCSICEDGIHDDCDNYASRSCGCC